MSWREFSPSPDLAEQCLVHGQLKQGAMEFCWDAAMSINVLYDACKLSPLNDRRADSTLKEKNHTSVPLHHSYVLSSQCPPPSGSAFTRVSFCPLWNLDSPNTGSPLRLIMSSPFLHSLCQRLVNHKHTQKWLNPAFLIKMSNLYCKATQVTGANGTVSKYSVSRPHVRCRCDFKSSPSGYNRNFDSS